MDSGTLQGIGTIFAMAAFVAICVWAWSAKNKKRFDEASRLPFIDEPAYKERSQDAPTDGDKDTYKDTYRDIDSQIASGKQSHE
jgi:cytochrome c oxidase cbb3-type subunit 4